MGMSWSVNYPKLATLIPSREGVSLPTARNCTMKRSHVKEDKAEESCWEAHGLLVKENAERRKCAGLSQGGLVVHLNVSDNPVAGSHWLPASRTSSLGKQSILEESQKVSSAIKRGRSGTSGKIQDQAMLDRHSQ